MCCSAVVLFENEGIPTPPTATHLSPHHSLEERQQDDKSLISNNTVLIETLE